MHIVQYRCWIDYERRLNAVDSAKTFSKPDLVELKLSVSQAELGFLHSIRLKISAF
jgi:hypothetical protein